MVYKKMKTENNDMALILFFTILINIAISIAMLCWMKDIKREIATIKNSNHSACGFNK